MGTFWSDENILCQGWGGSNMDVFVSNLLNFKFKMGTYILLYIKYTLKLFENDLFLSKKTKTPFLFVSF